MTAGLIAALAVSVLLAAALLRLTLKVFRKYGETLTELEDVRARLAAEEAGTAPLRLLTPAPDFRLEDLEGNERTLKDFLGKPLVVAFFNPACQFCRMIAPDLGQLPDDAPRVLVIASGDPEAVGDIATQYDWQCDVVLDGNWVVGTEYRIRGTPMGYLLDAEGRIASHLASGTQSVVRLATSAPDALDTSAANGNGSTTAAAGQMALRDISESSLKRDGLKAGTPAPDFTLPDLSGDERTLSSFFGKRILLVFSDTNCGPCQTLAPKLTDLRDRHRANNLEVVMVSRGGAEANQAKASEHGLTFPVLLQRSWEVSKQYGMFATPIAYLIDEQGVIAEDAAVGSEAILKLA